MASTTKPVGTPLMGVMMMREMLVAGWRCRPKRSRRSMTGMTSPRRFMTPSMKEGGPGDRRDEAHHDDFADLMEAKGMGLFAELEGPPGAARGWRPVLQLGPGGEGGTHGCQLLLILPGDDVQMRSRQTMRSERRTTAFQVGHLPLAKGLGRGQDLIGADADDLLDPIYGDAKFGSAEVEEDDHIPDLGFSGLRHVEELDEVQQGARPGLAGKMTPMT